MASLDFYVANFDLSVANLAGSGLGFYGSSGFGASVEVGSYQDNTYVTDGTGTIQGLQCSNIKYLNAQSGIVQTASSGIALQAIPNYQATLNPRFTHGSAVRTQNVKLRIYDRTNIAQPASGVTTKVAELIHPNVVQQAGGSGSISWVTPAGSSVIMSLTGSTGTSGLRPQGAATTDTRHDWYLAISASPDSIGSKTQFGLYISLEYL